MRKEHDDKMMNSFAPGGKAVVIGSGIAGLSAAQVLAKHFEQVTVLDRDWLPEEPLFRSGIPQANHAHTLLPYGQMILDDLFPGMVEQLLAEGAQALDGEKETAMYADGAWHKPEQHGSRPDISCSRPMLENLLYRRMAGFDRVKILQGVEVIGLEADENGSRVTGITVRSRRVGTDSPDTYHLPADLVVDASGRNSKAPAWLASLGFTPPEEWQIDSHSGYASRIYQQPEGAEREWKKLYIHPNAPDSPRGGVILPLEGGRWHVTLIGIAGDYPPTDEDGFLEFARSLPSPALYEAIRDAEPLSRITGYRKTENRVRRFENLPRYLEGLLVLGDAAFTMNPVYALGMTAAAVSSQVLDHVLRARSGEDGLASAFQKELVHRMDALWQLAVGSDWLWPATEISDNTEAIYPVEE